MQNLSAYVLMTKVNAFSPSSFKVSIEGAWFFVSLSCSEMLHTVSKSRFDYWLYVSLPSRLQQLIVLYFCPNFSVFYLYLHFVPVIKTWVICFGSRYSWVKSSQGKSLRARDSVTNSLFFFFSEVSYLPRVFSFPPPCHGKCELCLS